MAYTDVAMTREETRKQMAEALMGEEPKVGTRRAKSPGKFTHGDVWGPLNKAFRKKEAEDRRIEARKQEKFDKADWTF
jgi:hypothetical protein